ncbi:MAG: hypothetical protein ACI4VS_03585 [Candidatus Nanosyncoccaceae bacterium]
MKSKIHNIQKRVACLFIACVLGLSSLLALPVGAANISIANQDDIYEKLRTAAQINVLMNNLKKCFNAGSVYNYTSGSMSALSGSNLASGKVFYKPGSTGLTNTDHSTTLWLEDMIQGNGGDDGAIWCWQGQDDGNGLLQIYQEITGQSYADIVCNEGKGRIFQRAKYMPDMSGYGMGYYTYADSDENCSSMNDAGAMYVLKSDWADGFKASYNAWKSKADNKYLPKYDEIGLFNNIDGYFNYLEDYNKKCEADVYDKKPSGTTVVDLTTYEKSENKIVAKTKYYHVTENKSWKYGSSADNPVTTCQGLLERMHDLESNYNKVYDNTSDIKTDDDRKDGYEGIILAKLKKACNEMKDQEGKPAYDNLYKKLEEITKDEEASEDDKKKAQESMDKISAAKQKGTYVEITGKKTDEEGQTFQCLNIDQMQIIVDNYTNPLDNIGANDPDNDENEACYAGAGAMGWLLCPAIMSLEGLMDQVYSFVEEHFLKIRSDSIFNGTGSGQFRTNGVHEAWSKLQAIANIVFIIFFIVVLFSQITGVGISNYGIKKMLPKLIVTAVLINLSYIICAVLVDLSNVLGVGLRGLLESGLGIQAAQGAGAGAAVSGFLVAGSITLTSIIIAVCINPGLVVTLLLFLGSAAIAVLFLWLVLVVREVVVILGIVLSPVAFACSALPNTESLFKKWMKIMQAMLLLYPLCSLVVGGGQFAGRILASVGQSNAELGWTFNLAAMVAQVVPFFFIPSLLKGTLAGLGTLGAKLAQGQHALNANTMGRIRNSDRYKDFQMRSRAGMKADGTLSKRGELMNRGPFKAFNRGTNAARASYLGRKGQLKRMDKYSDKDYLAAARVAEDDRVYNEEVANALTLFDSQGATSADLLAAVSKDGGARSIAAIQKLAQKKDFNGIQQALATIDVAGLKPNERNKLGQTLAAMQDTDVIAGLYGKKLLKGDKYSYADYAKGNAKDKNGNSIVQKDLRNVDGAKLGRLDDNVYDSNSTFDYSQILRDNMSSDQMASLVSSTGDLNSKNLDKVNEHIIGKKIADEVSNGVRAEDSVFSGASGAQVSGISESTIDAINSNGGDAQKIFASGISEINSPKNAAIRVNMNSNAKTKLGVHETPTVLGHGTYALNSDPNNRVHLTQLDNGKYVDDGGFEVDITKYNKV